MATSFARPKAQELFESQKLALAYFAVAIVLFGAQLVFGLLAAYQYINPDFLLDKLPFMTNRTLHVNAMIVWLLVGLMGGVYWFLPLETGREVVGIKLAKFIWWVIVAGVGVVVLVYLFVQTGPGNALTLWFINEGREYVEAPRWADIAIVAWVAVFLYNVIATTLAARRITGLLGVLIFDLVALGALYTAGMHYTVNVTMDQYLWWWVVHLWVEATWEVLVGVVMGWSLMYLLGTPRKLIETWLFLEVALVFGTGILGLGHHYFWIGTPEYWQWWGSIFSAMEPIPFFMMTVFAFNMVMYSHGTQLAAAHGHLAFFGAYVGTVLTLVYIAVQNIRRPVPIPLDSKYWSWAFALLILGIFGIAGSFTISGFSQTMVERAELGSTWSAFIQSYTHPWYTNTLGWRFGFGLLFFVGYLILVYDFLTIGRKGANHAH